MAGFFLFVFGFWSVFQGFLGFWYFFFLQNEVLSLDTPHGLHTHFSYMKSQLFLVVLSAVANI